MFKKKAQPKKKAHRLLKDVNHAAANVGDAVREGTAPYLERANELLHEGGEALAPKLREASEYLQHTADRVRPRLEELGERVEAKSREGLKDARRSFDKTADEAAGRASKYLGDASDALGSAKTPAAVAVLAEKLTGDKKAAKKAQKNLAKRGRALAKQTKPKSKAGFGMWLFWILLTGAVGGIGYYIWKKAQPVEDPWSTPLPGNRPADARPVGSTPRSEQGAAATAPVVSEVPVPEAATSATTDQDADLATGDEATAVIAESETDSLDSELDREQFLEDNDDSMFEEVDKPKH
ncbi:hypothetical protein BRM1_10310 [Brevibacterium sp. BRM-1]|uniref:hypothetical protein n=1 Tax=Brevibacterium sp. BRM-1 TaxID=2999062 RepID=UPI0022819445|nr:hypothetical protein [Brevibacterium sp. BRM-1]WAL39650.1 hypothetical protein BRM1_10310 [Brevibacterium sp. BRM-1]